MFYEKRVDCVSLLPEQYRNVKEIEAIAKAIDQRIDLLSEKTAKTVQNRFVSEADAFGCERWEKILEVRSPEGCSLETRRQNLCAKLQSKPPINIHTVKRIVEAFLSASATVSVENYRMRIRYSGNVFVGDFTPLYQILYEMIPAVLLIAFQFSHIETTFVPVLAILTPRLRGEFYARQVVPYLYLDGMAKLDGRYLLHGYYTRDLCDFYPLGLRVSGKTAVPILSGSGINILGSVRIPKTNDMHIHFVSMPTAYAVLEPGFQTAGHLFVVSGSVSGVVASFDCPIKSGTDYGPERFISDVQKKIPQENRMAYTAYASICSNCVGAFPTAIQKISAPVLTDYSKNTQYFDMRIKTNSESNTKSTSSVEVSQETKGHLLVKKDYLTLDSTATLDGSHHLCAALYPYDY